MSSSLEYFTSISSVRIIFMLCRLFILESLISNGSAFFVAKCASVPQRFIAHIDNVSV